MGRKSVKCTNKSCFRFDTERIVIQDDNYCDYCGKYSLIEIYEIKEFKNNKQTDKNPSNCRIFREPEKWKQALVSNMSLGKYHVKRRSDARNIVHDDYSKLIIKLKNQDINAIFYFTAQLRDLLNYNEEYVICVIPSSKKGLADSGIRTIAKRLCKPPVIDGTDVIIRNRTVESNHTANQKRNLELELSTLTIVNEDIIKDKQILLLDDVATRGISLDAGRQKLKEVGAVLVAAIALGHTQFIN